MKTPKTVLACALGFGLLTSALMTPVAAAMERAEDMIRANALLAAVHERSPAAAQQFAREINGFLAAARQGESVDKEPRFRRRGGEGIQPGDPESEMERQNREVLERNPALRRMFFHSPVAYLRMLKRLRQATAAGSKAAAQ
ncbi:MAG: hypothetical protein R3229_12690 [Alphaproteobacteria bacterium]|nr:hypothetical protein [Alphaproteobacteria bacterium]